MPVVVTIFITVSTELGLLKLTVNTAGLPSDTIGELILTVGCGSSSVIVPVPWALVLLVFDDVTLPVTMKVSVGSLVVSCVVGTLTVTLVLPAGMVTVVVVLV